MAWWLILKCRCLGICDARPYLYMYAIDLVNGSIWDTPQLAVLFQYKRLFIVFEIFLLFSFL